MREKIDFTEEDGERSAEGEHVNSVLAEDGGGAGEAWPRDPSGGVRPIPGPKGDRGLRGRAWNEPSSRSTITAKALAIGPSPGLKLSFTFKNLLRHCSKQVFKHGQSTPHCIETLVHR